MGLEVGSRVGRGRARGWVRFVGAVDGVAGRWAGVEWDPGSGKGKHSGDVGGVSYFSVAIPKSASLVREEKVQGAVDLATEIQRKYFPAGGLGLGNCAGEEMVGMQHLDPGLRSEKVVLAGTAVGRIAPRVVRDRPADLSPTQRALDSVVELNLADCLLSSWRDVFNLPSCVPRIQTLVLSGNWISDAPPNHPEPATTFNSLQVLVLGDMTFTDCHFKWATVTDILRHTPHLRELRVHGNQWTDQDMTSSDSSLPSLSVLDLEGNHLSSWPSVVDLVRRHFPNLETLLLGNNHLTLDGYSRSTKRPSHQCQIQQLSLSGNPLASWAGLVLVASQLPEMIALRFVNTPLATESSDHITSRYTITPRQHVLGLIPQLLSVNGGFVSREERSEAEKRCLGLYKEEHRLGSYVRASDSASALDKCVDRLLEAYQDALPPVLDQLRRDEDIRRAQGKATLRDSCVVIRFTFPEEAVEWTRELPTCISLGRAARLAAVRVSLLSTDYMKHPLDFDWLCRLPPSENPLDLEQKLATLASQIDGKYIHVEVVRHT